MEDDNSPSYKFSNEVYEIICSKAQAGDIKELDAILSNHDSASFGPTTFCPDPKLHLSSPVVLAAQYGHMETLTYFFDKFGAIIDINHSATIVSRTTKKKVHHATALWAACTGGHIDIVKLLVEKGANVNKTTLTQSTPLRGASFHGFIDVMEYLIQSGANINTPNCIGQSPLCIAAMRGEVDAVKFLMNKGADVNQTTINSYSVMHLAAAKGKDEVIQCLLDSGVSPQFQIAVSDTRDYVPCPLFLAASTGQAKSAQILMDHNDCPSSCKADANLLLASMQCELRKRLRITEPKIQEYWEEGLRIHQELDIKPHYLPAQSEYGDRVEIKTLQELSSRWFDPDFIRKEAFYQSLIIRERCMGSYDQGLIYFLIRRGLYFCQEKRYQEAELLWRRAMRLEVLICEMEIRHPTFGHCEGTMRDIEKDLNVYSEGVSIMVGYGYIPDFSRYIHYGFDVLKLMSRLSTKADGEVINYAPILGLVMELFMSWIIYCTGSLSRENLTWSTLSVENLTWSKECDELGQIFVSKYLYYAPGTTLLHLALTNFVVSENEERNVLDRFNNLTPLVTALISWGADEVINLPNDSGNRPLHVAISTMLVTFALNDAFMELISPLVEGGAHLDAVNSNGITIYDMCGSEDDLKILLYSYGPFSLSCFSARAVVRHGIDYTSLPSRVQDFVKFHDHNNMRHC